MIILSFYRTQEGHLRNNILSSYKVNMQEQAEMLTEALSQRTMGNHLSVR